MRLFLVGLSIALAEDVPLLRGSNLTKPSNLTKAASSDAEDVMPSNLTKSAASGRIIGKDVLYDKIMGYWVPLSAFDTPSISFTTLNALLSLVAYPPHLLYDWGGTTGRQLHGAAIWIPVQQRAHALRTKDVLRFGQCSLSRIASQYGWPWTNSTALESTARWDIQLTFYIKHSSKEILISWCFLYVVLDLKVPTQMMTRILSLWPFTPWSILVWTWTISKLLALGGSMCILTSTVVMPCGLQTRWHGRTWTVVNSHHRLDHNRATVARWQHVFFFGW